MYNNPNDGTEKKDSFSQLRPSAASTSSNMTPLPPNFEPGPDDVICGRGKKCYNHIGNERFRLRVLTYLDEYSAAKSKLDKSGVLSKVVDAVRQQSPSGGFVKQDEKGRWHEVGDFLAREKTSQSFRDALHDRYKSSNISKKKRRQEEQNKYSVAGHSPRAQMMIPQQRSEYEISSRLERLSNELLNSQEIQDIDYFTRRNSDALQSQRSYDMQSQLPMRLQQSVSTQQYLASNRRFSGGSVDFMGSRRERPMVDAGRMPDPLFGTASNTVNATPSELDREALATATSLQRDFEHNRSMALSEPDYNRSEHIPFASMEPKSFHMSYPEMGYHNLFEDYSLHQQLSMHQSFPEIALAKHGSIEGDRKRPAKEMEPIPLDHINIPGRGRRKATEPESFMKKVSSTQFSSAAPTSAPDNIQFPSSHVQQPTGTRTVGGQRISRELMECLDKMTYHSIADDNPFEPIPLAPHQEAALLVHRRSSDVSTPTYSQQHQPTQSQSQSQSQNPLIDDSDRDEFAEG